MIRLRVPQPLFVFPAVVLAACGGAGSSSTSGSAQASRGSGSEAGEFQLSGSDDAGRAHGDHPSAIEATATEAAMRFFVVDSDAGPISGMVVKLIAADGRAFYTGETDSVGYAEVLVPAGQRYDIEYLSLGRRTTTAHVDVPTGPRQDIRLTLRYRHRRPEGEPERLVLEGLLFESNSATLTADSLPRLDGVVEYLVHHPSARIRISGHTDDVGDPRRNQQLSEARARAVRDYVVAHGVESARVEAVGLGDTQPVAPNDTDEGRARNRRIEVIEL